MAPSHHDREEETLIAYFQQMLAEVDDEEFDGELQEHGDLQAAPADESSYSKEANAEVLSSANAAIDASHHAAQAAQASAAAVSPMTSDLGNAGAQGATVVSAAGVVAQQTKTVTPVPVVAATVVETPAPLKKAELKTDDSQSAASGIVISNATEESVSSKHGIENDDITGSSVDRAYEAISNEPFIAIDVEEPEGDASIAATTEASQSATSAVSSQTAASTSAPSTRNAQGTSAQSAATAQGTSVPSAATAEGLAVPSAATAEGIAAPSAATVSVDSSTAGISTQSSVVVAETEEKHEIIETQSSDDGIVIERVVSGGTAEAQAASSSAEAAADAAMIAVAEQGDAVSSDAVANAVKNAAKQDDALEDEFEKARAAHETAVAEEEANAAMIAAAEHKGDSSSEAAADAAMIAAQKDSDLEAVFEKVRAAHELDVAEEEANAAMIAAAEHNGDSSSEAAADAAMIAAQKDSDLEAEFEKVRSAHESKRAEDEANAAMIAAAEQKDASSSEAAADAAMIAAQKDSELEAEFEKVRSARESEVAEQEANAAMLAAVQRTDAAKTKAAIDAALRASKKGGDLEAEFDAIRAAYEAQYSSNDEAEPQLQTATKTEESTNSLEYAEPTDNQSLQRLLNTIVPQQVATETKVETKVAEPKLETKVAEPKVETKVAEPKVETKVAEPKATVATPAPATPAATPDTKVAAVSSKKKQEVIKTPQQIAEERMADKLHAINKDWKNVDLGEQFQVLFFLVQGVRFAVPLIDLGGIFECDKITNLFGKPSWFMGITDVRGDKINIVDTLRWVKPDIKESPEKYPYLISLGMSPWSIGCDILEGNRTLTSSQIRWREIPGNRPWLAGIVTAEKCALLHVKALISLFEAGADIEDLTRTITEDKSDKSTKTAILTGKKA